MGKITRENIQIRDPFVVAEDGAYYLFGSTDKDIWKAKGTGFDVYKSTDLETFSVPFPAFRPDADFWSDMNFWAPEVHRFEGAWYMFATFLPKEGSGFGYRGTAVLKSTAGVMGPYVPHSTGPVTPRDWVCLDGTLFVDDGGKPWMVFCHEWYQVGDGTICAVALSPDLRCAVGDPTVLFHASDAPWSAPLKGRAPGSYVTDGPFLWRDDGGALLLLWSSFDAEGAYCIGVARSESSTLAGPWKQSPSPLSAALGITDGGHGMLFRDLAGKTRLAIHRPNKTPLERAVFIEVSKVSTESKEDLCKIEK